MQDNLTLFQTLETGQSVGAPMVVLALMVVMVASNSKDGASSSKDGAL